LIFALSNTDFNVYRVVKLTGPFVSMIYKMCLGDLLRFGVIYVIFLAGFTQGRIRSVQNMVIARILSNIVLR